jgi:hypothetical protein
MFETVVAKTSSVFDSGKPIKDIVGSYLGKKITVIKTSLELKANQIFQTVIKISSLCVKIIFFPLRHLSDPVDVSHKVNQLTSSFKLFAKRIYESINDYVRFKFPPSPLAEKSSFSSIEESRVPLKVEEKRSLSGQEAPLVIYDTNSNSLSGLNESGNTEFTGKLSIENPALLDLRALNLQHHQTTELGGEVDNLSKHTTTGSENREVDQRLLEQVIQSMLFSIPHVLNSPFSFKFNQERVIFFETDVKSEVLGLNKQNRNGTHGILNERLDLLQKLFLKALSSGRIQLNVFPRDIIVKHNFSQKELNLLFSLLTDEKKEPKAELLFEDVNSSYLMSAPALLSFSEQPSSEKPRVTIKQLEKRIENYKSLKLKAKRRKRRGIFDSKIAKANLELEALKKRA